MSSASDPYDIAFLGHVCYDEVIPFQGERRVGPGSAVLCGALAAARVGKRVEVVTRLALRDQKILEALHQNGVAVHVIPSVETTYIKVVHPTADGDVRQIFQLKKADFFSLAVLPPLAARRVHLAGVTDHEFDLNFIAGLKEKGFHLSADMHGFVRQVDPVAHSVAFRDVPLKKEIVRRLEIVKLDDVEAGVLTGTDDLAQAARIIEAWGCPEVVITQAEGVLAQANGMTFYERFSNRSVVGRIGRGGTAIAAYLARRLDHDPGESLKFAAALVSIKLETPGPFNGTLEDVLARMR